MRFTLAAGLILREGMTTIELVRQLSEDEFQFENIETRRAKTLTRDQILDGVYRKKYSVVVGDLVKLGQADPKQEHKLLDITSLTARERRQLDRRYEYVKAISRARISRGRRAEIKQFVERLAAKNGEKPPSASSVMSWIRKYEISRANPLALVDRYRAVPRKKRLPEAVEAVLWEVLRKEYFTKAKLSAKHAYKQLQRAIDAKITRGEIAVNDPVPSYQTLTRRINDVDKYHRIASREGSKRAEMVCRTSFPDGYPSYPLERVEIDHTPLNWVIVCDRTGLPLGRPILSVMLDAYSGYVLGFYVSFYGAGLTSVCGLVKNALQPRDALLKEFGIQKPWLGNGIGDEWVIDNGLEFHSTGFKQMAQLLGVDLMYCKVRTPWLKPRVERFFAGLDFLTLTKGRVRKTQANAWRVDPYKDAAIIFSDFIYGLTKFIVEVYPFTPNWKKMATPFELFKEGLERCPAAVYPGSLDELKFVAGMSKTLTFSQGGVSLEGMPYGSYGFKDLARRMGTGFKVDVKWDPDDMGEICVQDPVTKQWIDAQCRWSEYARGLSYNQHKLIKAHARQHLNHPDQQMALHRAQMELHDHWLDSTRGRKRADSLKAARYAGYTSSRVLQPIEASDRVEVPSPNQEVIVPQKLHISSEIEAEKEEIPTFESFVMRGGSL